MTSYRVTLTPSQGAAKVFQIGQPALRVTIAAGGGASAVVPIPTRAASGEVVQVVGYTVAGGGYDGDTLAKIAAKQALGWPDYAIWVRVMGEANTVPVSASASVPSFAAFATLTAPAVTAGFNATVTVPQFSALATLTAPSVSAVMNAAVSAPQFAASATLTAPSVTAGYLAVVPVGSFTAVSIFNTPTVAAQIAALVNGPSFGAAAALTVPAVSVTPAGAQAATASVPSFAAAAAFAAPTVYAQLAATVTAPQFSAYAAITPPSVTAQRQGVVSVASFGAVSTLTAPSVTAQRQAVAAVPSFGATASLTAPNVTAVQQAAPVSATVTVPQFTASAALTAPNTTAQRRATVTGPSFTATSTMTVPAVTGVQNSAAAVVSGQVLFDFNADWSGFSSRVVLPNGGVNVTTPTVIRNPGTGTANAVRFVSGQYNNGTGNVAYGAEIYQTLNFAEGTVSFSAYGVGTQIEVYIGGVLIHTTPTLTSSYATHSFAVTTTGSKEVALRQIVTAVGLDTYIDDIVLPLAVTKLAFETADVTDSAGNTWTKYIESGGDYTVTGEIISGVVGGDVGNCLKVKPSIYDDGEVSVSAPTYITKTGLSVGRGVVTVRYKNENDSYARVFLKVGAATVGSTNSAAVGWSTLSITVPSVLANATVQVGVDGTNPSYNYFYIDEVLIPAP